MAPYGEWDSIDDTKANIGRWPDEAGASVYSKKEHRPIPVGQYAPNRWGVHDMLGNLDEWCLDTYSDSADVRDLPPVDPVRASEWSVFRVVRGGSYIFGRTVFYKEGDAESGGFRGIRVVVEIDDCLRSCLKQCKGNDVGGIDGFPE
jgi:hypothetical protein